MNTPGSNLPAWLPEAIRNDPRKSGILALLLLVLVAVVLKMTVFTGPTVARASATTTKKTKDADPRHKAAGAQSISPATRDWLQKPITSVSRNLFVIRPEYFPSTLRKVESSNKPDNPGFWDAIEKSQSEQADQKKRREILVENLQREAAKLRVQSTMMGPEPQAIIGGSLVKEGDVVASDTSNGGVQFRVLVIETRRVIVEREGIRLAIHMKQ